MGRLVCGTCVLSTLLYGKPMLGAVTWKNKIQPTGRFLNHRLQLRHCCLDFGFIVKSLHCNGTRAPRRVYYILTPDARQWTVANHELSGKISLGWKRRWWRVYRRRGYPALPGTAIDFSFFCFFFLCLLTLFTPLAAVPQRIVNFSFSFSFFLHQQLVKSLDASRPRRCVSFSCQFLTIDVAGLVFFGPYYELLGELVRFKLYS